VPLLGEGGVLSQKNIRVAHASIQSLSIPAKLKRFSNPAVLLPGERLHDFEIIREMMIDEIRPATGIEWLWTLDLVEMSWEILRYRGLKNSVLDAYRAAAIEAILWRLDGAGIPAAAAEILRLQTVRTAAEWRDDPEAAAEIEARLQRHGFDAAAINAEVFVQARDTFAIFDELMQRAQHRRILLLREMSVRREFAKRAEQISEALMNARARCRSPLPSALDV
jgi:hypothetical protein